MVRCAIAPTFATGVSGFVSATNAPTIHALNGISTASGGAINISFLSVGGEYTTFSDAETKDQYCGGTMYVGGAVSTPIEIHGSKNYSLVVLSLNIRELLKR